MTAARRHGTDSSDRGQIVWLDAAVPVVPGGRPLVVGYELGRLPQWLANEIAKQPTVVTINP